VLAAAVAVVVVGAVLGWLLERSDRALLYPYWIGLLLVPLISLTSLRQAAMQGLGRVVLGRLPETVIAPLLAILFVLVAYGALGDDLSASWAIALQVSAAGAAFVLGAWFLRRTLPSDARAAAPTYETREWLRSALPLFLMSGLLALNMQLGTIFLGSMEGASAAGVYAVATRTALFVGFLWLAATYPLMPTLARLHALGDRRGLQRVLTRSARVTVLGTLPLLVGIVVFSRPLLEIFGQGFGGGADALRIIALGEFARVATGFAGIALLMSGHEGSLTRGVAVGAGLNVVLNVALVPLWGVNGSAVASAISAAASSVFLVYLAWDRIRVSALPFGIKRPAASVE
jgi:O-antigen/teichoic acid export membrane protein